MSYHVTLELEAKGNYDVGQVAAAIGLALSDYEGTQDLELGRIDVERVDA